MPIESISRPLALPLPLQRRSTDEFKPIPYTTRDKRSIARVLEEAPKYAHRINMSLPNYLASRLGTATALKAINAEWGHEYYKIPETAVEDQAIADSALGGDQLVIDIQTHYIADRPACQPYHARVMEMFKGLMPDGFKGLKGMEEYNFGEFLRCVFLESDTAVAVLSSPPGIHDDRMLSSAEMAGSREVIDRLAGTGRLINHTFVHPKMSGELDHMDNARGQYKPAGWKVYTMGLIHEGEWVEGSAWMLDDKENGLPFLERCLELESPIVCVHKGISFGIAQGSPIDVGPAASAFPNVKFLIYHSGYEVPVGEKEEEGPYSEDTAHIGTNRLIKSLKDAQIGQNSNVYAELGTTWFCLIRRPREAAHVLGKLLVALGEDNVLWGTDAVWYGPPQPFVDAFRAFQIPLDLREKYGYPELTATVKEKILGLNAARIHKIDVARTRAIVRNDTLSWVRTAIKEYTEKGFPFLR